MYTGKVVSFSFKKGFGFIEFYKDEIKQPDMFVWYEDILHDGFKVLYPGQVVEFEIEKYKDKDKAINVRVIV